MRQRLSLLAAVAAAFLVAMVAAAPKCPAPINLPIFESDWGPGPASMTSGNGGPDTVAMFSDRSIDLGGGVMGWRNVNAYGMTYSWSADHARYEFGPSSLSYVLDPTGHPTAYTRGNPDDSGTVTH